VTSKDGEATKIMYDYQFGLVYGPICDRDYSRLVHFARSHGCEFRGGEIDGGPHEQYLWACNPHDVTWLVQKLRTALRAKVEAQPRWLAAETKRTLLLES
jgi:hypothetical protein